MYSAAVSLPLGVTPTATPEPETTAAAGLGDEVGREEETGVVSEPEPEEPVPAAAVAVPERGGARRESDEIGGLRPALPDADSFDLSFKSLVDIFVTLRAFE